MLNRLGPLSWSKLGIVWGCAAVVSQVVSLLAHGRFGI